MTTVPSTTQPTLQTPIPIPPGVQSCFLSTEATMGPRIPSQYVCRDPECPTPHPLYAEELTSPAHALAEDRSGQTARFERLSRVRAQIAAGTYHVSAAELADVFIQKLRSGSILR